MTRMAPRVRGKELTELDTCRLIMYIFRSARIGKACKAYEAAVKEAREQRKPRTVKGVDGKEKVVGWHPPGGHHKLRCGAKTRAGGTCQAPVVKGGKRCRMHGGLGRARIMGC